MSSLDISFWHGRCTCTGHSTDNIRWKWVSENLKIGTTPQVFKDHKLKHSQNLNARWRLSSTDKMPSAMTPESEHFKNHLECLLLAFWLFMNGQQLQHDPHPLHLHNEHMSKTSAKLKNRIKQSFKLASTTCATNASMLCILALAPCYSVTEYCCPVWWRSSYTGSVTNLTTTCISFQVTCSLPRFQGCKCMAQWSTWVQFINDREWCSMLNPGCWIAGSHVRWLLTTEANNQTSLTEVELAQTARWDASHCGWVAKCISTQMPVCRSSMMQSNFSVAV